MSQPTPATTAPAAAAAQLPPTHELQQKLMQNVASLKQLADARARGDDAAAEAMVKKVHDELAALAGAADLQNKAEAEAAGRTAAH